MLGACLAAAYVLHQPRQYSSTAYVAAPALLGGQSGFQYSGTQGGADSYVSTFIATATSMRIAKAAAKDARISPRAVLDGLTITQVKSSAQMQVTYQDAKPAVARVVASSVAGNTLKFMFGEQVVLAQRRVNEAASAVKAANADAAAWAAEHGGPPDQRYAADVQRLSDLQAQGITRGPLVTGLRRELASLSSLMGSYQTYTDERTAAVAMLTNAQQALQSAESQLDAASPSAAVTISDTVRVSLLPGLVRAVVPAAGAGAFLAVGLIALLEMVASRRRDANDEAAARPHTDLRVLSSSGA